jgi:Bacterial membrane protein YfhO
MKAITNSKLSDYFFIIMVAIIAYWPVSFMLFSVKNDAINYFLAMRYNTSEAIQHGYFPSWLPYINMGYPAHGDVQAGVWNPVVILMSFIRKYDIYWLQVETIVTIIISGIGMYHLLKHFKFKRNVVLTISAAYMLNGYITDSGQFLNWLYAAAYLPFVFLYAIRCFESFKIKDAFLLGLFYSFMLLSAYPSDFIQLGYILAAYIVVIFFKHQKNHSVKISAGVFVKQLAVAAISFLIICLPALISYVPFIRSIDRGSGVDLGTALTNSMAPVNFISFATPWPTLKATFNQYTDPLIRNCYPGIILLLFFILSLVSKQKKTLLHWFLFGIFLFFILFSLGKLGGIRVLSFQFLPLMDTFRHPANSKLFFVFAAQLIAAFYINDYFTLPSFNKLLLRRVTLFSIALVTTAVIISFLAGNIADTITRFFAGNEDRQSLKQLMTNLSFTDLLLLNCLLLLATLLVFYLALKKNSLKKYLLPLVVVEMLITAQLMLPLTYARTSTPKETQAILYQQPKGYPIPDANASIASFSADGMKYFDIIGCLNPYNKQPGRSDYIITPSNLSSQQNFWENIPLRNKIIQYPLFYFADTIYAVKDTTSFISSVAQNKAAIIAFENRHTVSGQATTGNIRILKFAPGHVDIETEKADSSFLVFLQNHYPNWSAYVNGKENPLVKTNLTFMGLPLPAGKNRIEFVYKSGYLKILSSISVLYILCWFVYIYKSNKRKN